MQPNKTYNSHVRGASQCFAYFGEPQHVDLVGEQVGTYVGALSGRRMRGRILHDCLCVDKMLTRATTEDDTAPNMTSLHPVMQCCLCER